ncbi:MAG: hypothetical protein Q7K26_01800 [bacterium]|nr:hypothetical protein [bacterium]
MSENNVEGVDSLDSYFPSEHDDVRRVQDVDHVESSRRDDHNDEGNEPGQNESFDEPKKSIFKRWYFWVGSLVLFLGIVGALYVQQMMALRSSGQTDQSPIVMADPIRPQAHSVAAASQASSTVVIDAAAASLAADRAVILPIAVATSAASSSNVPNDVMPSGNVTKTSAETGKNINSTARIEELEKQVSLLSSQLKEERSAKQAALDRAATIEKNALTVASKSHQGSKRLTNIKARRVVVSNVKEVQDLANFTDYRIDAITPGQARVTHGSISEYITVGSAINGSKVLSINPDVGEVVTNRGRIR